MKNLIDLTGLQTFLGECRNEFANNQEFATVSSLVDELNEHISNALDNNPVTIRNGKFFTQRLESGEIFTIKPNSLLFVQGGSNVNEFVNSSGQLISTIEPDAGISTMETGIIFNTNLGPNENTYLAEGEFRSFLMLKGSFSITNISNILTTRNYKATKNNFCLRAKERIYIFALEYDESLYNKVTTESILLTGDTTGGSKRTTVDLSGNLPAESDGTQKYSARLHMYDRSGNKKIDILAKEDSSSYVGVYDPSQTNIFSQQSATEFKVTHGSADTYSTQLGTDFKIYKDKVCTKQLSKAIQSGQVNNMVVCNNEANYESITNPDANTLYIILDDNT